MIKIASEVWRLSFSRDASRNRLSVPTELIYSVVKLTLFLQLLVLIGKHDFFNNKCKIKKTLDFSYIFSINVVKK